MASSKLMTTKDGKKYYRIRVSMGKGKPYLSENWYAPDGWSEKSIERGLRKAEADFESRCKNGEVLSREDTRKAEEARKLEEGKIKTLRQYGEKVYMPQLAITCAETTRDKFQGDLNKHIYPALGEYKITEITPEQISSFLLSLQAPQPPRKPLKHASVIKIYTVLNLIFKKAYLSRMIQTNPMDFVLRPKPTKAEGKKGEVEYFNKEQLQYIIRCANEQELKWRVYILLSIDTGCRRGEICGLKWDCVDFKDNSITIKRNLCYTPAKGVYVDTPKSGKERTIFVDPAIMVLLKQMKAEQKKILKAENEDEVTVRRIQGDGFVFTRDTLYNQIKEGSGQTVFSPMNPNTPRLFFRRFGEKYGIEDFHPHKLRHSFASVAITEGADIASVSEILGHADKATTLKMYTHADQEAQKKAGNLFRNSLKMDMTGTDGAEK